MKAHFPNEDCQVMLKAKQQVGKCDIWHLESSKCVVFGWNLPQQQSNAARKASRENSVHT